MAVSLYEHQWMAIDKMKNGCILCGGVGSGKSITSIAYYIFKECHGDFKDLSSDSFSHKKFKPMKDPRDLYIITTAKKRDSLDWKKECSKFALEAYNVNVVIDSWNCIKKYRKISGSFFIFDEQRVVGSGAWVKAFLDITRKNHWVLLSATPGDTWSDYIPVFIANGFYRNKTDFNSQHCVFSRFSKYPRIERYVGERLLRKRRDKILVPMKDCRLTERYRIDCIVDYDKELYKEVFIRRWDPWDDKPIEETGKLMYLTRKVINSDQSRIEKVDEIFQRQPKLIIFYNHTYELELLKDHFSRYEGLEIAEWNGRKHDGLPIGSSWIYLVQYTAGCEGWNCTTTDTIVFYSQNYSYRVMEQAAGRIDRINTPYVHLHYYHLRSMAPIDVAILRALKSKKKFNESSFLKG